MELKEECYCYELEGSRCELVELKLVFTKLVFLELVTVLWLVWEDIEIFVYIFCSFCWELGLNCCR